MLEFSKACKGTWSLLFSGYKAYSQHRWAVYHGDHTAAGLYFLSVNQGHFQQQDYQRLKSREREREYMYN